MGGIGLEGCFYGELCYYLRLMNFRKNSFLFFHAILPDKSKQYCFLMQSLVSSLKSLNKSNMTVGGGIILLNFHFYCSVD